MALQTVEAFEELGYSVIELVIIKMDGKGHTLFRMVSSTSMTISEGQCFWKYADFLEGSSTTTQ